MSGPAGHRLSGRADPARDAGHAEHPAAGGVLHRHHRLHRLQGLRGGVQGVERRPGGRRPGAPGNSFDNTMHLGASTWRHVAFVEQTLPPAGPDHSGIDVLSLASGGGTGPDGEVARPDFRWLMACDVCKHCTEARLPRRLPDRVAVPHRVRHGRRPAGHLQRLRLLRLGLPVRRHRPARGRRPRVQVHALLRPDLGEDRTPACAKACPTESIQFGDLDELRERAQERRRRAARRGRRRRTALRRRPERRRRRLRGVLHAARRARDVRAAARPGRHHPGPARPCGGTRRSPRRGCSPVSPPSSPADGRGRDEPQRPQGAR